MSSLADFKRRLDDIANGRGGRRRAPAPLDVERVLADSKALREACDARQAKLDAEIAASQQAIAAYRYPSDAKFFGSGTDRFFESEPEAVDHPDGRLFGEASPSHAPEPSDYSERFREQVGTVPALSDFARFFGDAQGDVFSGRTQEAAAEPEINHSFFGG